MADGDDDMVASLLQSMSLTARSVNGTGGTRTLASSVKGSRASPMMPFRSHSGRFKAPETLYSSEDESTSSDIESEGDSDSSVEEDGGFRFSSFAPISASASVTLADDVSGPLRTWTQRQASSDSAQNSIMKFLNREKAQQELLEADLRLIRERIQVSAERDMSELTNRRKQQKEAEIQHLGNLHQAHSRQHQEGVKRLQDYQQEQRLEQSKLEEARRQEQQRQLEAQQRAEKERAMKQAEEATKQAAIAKAGQEEEKKRQAASAAASVAGGSPQRGLVGPPSPARTAVPSPSSSAGTGTATATRTVTGTAGRQVPPYVKQALSRMEKLVTIQEMSAKINDSTQPEIKRLRTQVKKTVNLSIQQISASMEQIVKKAEEMKQLMKLAQQEGEIMYQYTCNMVADKFKTQAESLIARSRSSCFPYAQTIVLVSVEFPLLLELVLAYLNKACPFTVPYFPAKAANETDDDLRVKWGYLRKEDGSLEAEDDFIGRMEGFMALFAAIPQCPVTVGRNFMAASVPHPFGIDQAWLWLARLLNQKIRRLTCMFLYVFLDIAGFSLCQSYPNQMKKVFILLAQSAVPQFEELKAKGTKGLEPALTNLRLYLTEYIRSGQARKPEGKDIPTTSLSQRHL
eukprot:GILK01008864.1.p1 GENE.GILK01008864.1~~GILK01008864.1.p1  ORF type:complete len:641 (-),score=138.38 GILK01008864.1:60-1949(-)